jgi:hypothetical protein
MESIFNTTDAKNLIARVEKLSPESQPEWGKMNVSQMAKHCEGTFLVAFNELDLKLPFIHRMLGRVMKNKIIYGTFGKNSPTAKELIIKGTPDLEETKKELIDQINRISQGYHTVTCHNHAFYGKMNEKDWGTLLYKHTDHHLKQFGV